MTPSEVSFHIVLFAVATVAQAASFHKRTLPPIHFENDKFSLIAYQLDS